MENEFKAVMHCPQMPHGGWVWVTVNPPTVIFKFGPHALKASDLKTFLRDSVRVLDLPPTYWVMVQEYPSMNLLYRTTVKQILRSS